MELAKTAGTVIFLWNIIVINALAVISEFVIFADIIEWIFIDILKDCKYLNFIDLTLK